MQPPISEDDVSDLLRPLPSHSFLRNFVLYAANCTDCHLAYHLPAALVTLAQTCPIDFSFPFGTAMYSHLFGLCIGKSTDSRKSASIGVARDLLDTALPGAVSEEPGSKENLIDALRHTPRQLVMYPEFGAFLAQTEKGYLNPLRTTYTSAWDAQPLGRATLTKKRTGEGGVAMFPRLSLLGGSTLDYLERHTEPVDWTGGFLARFLTFYGDRTRTYDVPPGFPSMRSWLITQLQDLNQQGVYGGKVRGQCLGFDLPARQMWKKWYDGITKVQSQDETAGAIARTHSHALKVALLLAWDFGDARCGTDWYITTRELIPALAIAQLHIRSVLRVGESLAPTPDMRNRRTVLQAIGAKPRPLADILRDSRLLKRSLMAIIETLLEEGMIKQYQGPEVAGGAWYIRLTNEQREEKFRAPAQESVITFPGGTPPQSNVIQFEPHLQAAQAAQVTSSKPHVTNPPVGTVFGPDGSWVDSEGNVRYS